MPIHFHCSNLNCRTTLEVPEERAGKKARCPKCRTVCLVPAAKAEAHTGESSGFEATLAVDTGASPEDAAAHFGGDRVPPGPGAEVDDQVPVTVSLESQGTSIGLIELEGTLDSAAPAVTRYLVEGELAHGGMGAVMLCTDKTIRRPVAMKLMREQIADSAEFRLRFLEEAQVTGQLEHPNIVPIHELGKDSAGNLYFTMKLVKGRSLGEALKELKSVGEKKTEKPGSPQTPKLPNSHTPTPSLPDLLNIFLKVCDGIAFAHSKRVVHRDLKPENIMVGDFGEVLVMDWGLAKVFSDHGPQTTDHRPGEEEGEEANVEHPTPSTERPTEEGTQKTESEIRKADTVRSVRTDSEVALTMQGAVQGTPAYMPPEQARGKVHLVDERSDVYSLGAILYEILTLERPVEGKTVEEVLKKVTESRVVPPEERAPGRHIPKELSAVAMKAMSKNRRKRYQSVRDLSRDITLFLEGRAVSAKEDRFSEAVLKLVKRNKAVSVSIAAAALILLSMGALFTWDNAKKRRIAEHNEHKALEAQRKQRENALSASEALARQAVRAIEENRMGEAEIRADAAVKLLPDGPWGHYAQGMVELAKKSFTDAERHFHAALRHDPDHRESRTALAQASGGVLDVSRAAEVLAGKAGAGDWHAMKQAAGTLFRAERYRDAEKAFAKAILLLDKPKRVPKEDRDWGALLSAADGLMASGLYPDAKATYEKAMHVLGATRDTPQEVLSRARTGLGQSEKSVAELTQELQYARGDADAWVKCEGFEAEIRRLPVSGQCERIREKLTELHGKAVAGWARVPGDGGASAWYFDREEPPPSGGVMQFVSFSGSAFRYLHPFKGLGINQIDIQSTKVTDLTPLRGMPLRFLNAVATPLKDLTALSGTRLERLHITQTRVTDLSPLEGMPLRELKCQGASISDLSPAKEMPLVILDIGGSRVADLSPLEGMSLKWLNCGGAPVQDLSVLEGMPLEYLNCGNTAIRDLTVLRGLPLRELHIAFLQITDLSPLEGMPLTKLVMTGTKVTDISPLKGAPLTYLFCSYTPVQDFAPLIGMKLTTLCCSQVTQKDLSIFKDLPLVSLTMENSPEVIDLAPLKTLRLQELCCWFSGISDLSPLQGMPLRTLHLAGTKVTDVTPLKDLSLEVLSFDPGKISHGIEALRVMGSIRQIGTHYSSVMSPVEFWKKYDAGELK